jgi:toxin-antitoxin system protein
MNKVIQSYYTRKEDIMSVISLRVPENELNIFKSYAKHNDKSLSEIIRITMLERIEDEYDLKAFEEYEAEKQSGTLKTRPVSELWKELDL